MTPVTWLFTRDGRLCGNATFSGTVQREARLLYAITTDSGWPAELTEDELRERFFVEGEL